MDGAGLFGVGMRIIIFILLKVVEVSTAALFFHLNYLFWELAYINGYKLISGWNETHIVVKYILSTIANIGLLIIIGSCVYLFYIVVKSNWELASKIERNRSDKGGQGK